MTMIRLTTLGTTDLRNAAGESIGSVIRQPRRFALLVFLALESRRGFVRRDRVLAVFWPEVSTDQGRRSLSQALHYLRQSLGPAAIVGRGQEDLQLDLGLVACDACQLLDAIDAADPDGALRLLGGDFLPGFFCSGVPDFDGWLEQARAELRRAGSDAAWAAAERASGRREWVTAAALARRAAELAGGEEASIRRLMAFLAGLGDRAGALEAYELLARHLERDFEVAPSEPTRRLAAEIRDLEQATSLPSELPLVPPPTPDSAPAAGPAGPAPGWRRAVRRYGEPVRSVVVTGLLMFGFIGLWGLRRADEPAVHLDGAGLLVEEARGSSALSPRLTAEVVRQLSGLNQIDVLVDGARPGRAPRAAELALRTTFAGPADALTATVAIVDRVTGKTIASSQVESGGPSDSDAASLAAGIARFARVTVGAELERRRHELAQVSADVRLDLETVRTQLLAADSFANAGLRQTERLQLASTDSLLADIEAREPRWIIPALQRAEAAYRRMWAYLLPPAASDRHARAAMRDGMAHAARAIDMDPGDARGFEMRGVFGYFIWVTAPSDSAGAAAAWLALARSDLQRATQLSREASRAWNYLSVILFQDGNYAGAYLAAANALRADQFMTHAFSNRVRLFWSALELGDFTAADRWCRAIDEDDPASAEGEYCTLVLAAWAPQFTTITPAAAGKLVETALLAPDAEPSRLRAAHAVILANHGDASGARGLLRLIQEKSADDPVVVDIAWVYTALGDHATAKRILDDFVSREPASRAGITRSARFTSYRAGGTLPTTRTVAVQH